jgi:SAM-dependent methyltransferase
MLDGLFVAPAVAAVTEALRSARADDGRLAVIGNAKLATALAKPRDVIAVGLTARAAKKHPGALADLSSVEASSLAGVIGVDVSLRDDWEPALREWARVVRDGGVLVMLDRGRAAEASRRALCAGLTELEQRHAGRLVVTSGLVTHR